MSFFIFKTLHIVGFVSWFAGMFYLVRMFVYHVEALEKQEPERSILSDQLHIMQTRVYKIICTPAMNITWICGFAMLYIYGIEWLKLNPWMHFKLFLLILLTIYQLLCKKYIAKLKNGERPMNSFYFRLFNEIPTLFLIFISSLAVFKNNVNYLILILVIIAAAILLILLTKLYKKVRNK